jgi:ABC-type uncharacterized transport system substrate-binding protein
MDGSAMLQKNRTYLFTLTAPMLFLATLCGTMGGSIFRPRPIHAHPHAFIVQRLTVLFNEKGMAGIRVCWKFDEMFSSMIAEDHDQNRNGRFEANEMKALEENAFEPIAQENYFTFIQIDGQPFAVKFITDFTATLENQRLTYEFTIPCHVAASPQLKKITIGCYDPSYYTAIFFARNRPVSLIGDAAFVVQTAVREDPDTLIYFDMIHPWALFLEFRTKE